MNDIEQIDIEQVKHTAIIIVYPDGYVERLPIDGNVLHMRYFLKLLEKSPRFYNMIQDYEVELKQCFEMPSSAYLLDKYLTQLGIIVIKNINIYDIVNDVNFLEHESPLYSLGFPKTLTFEQTEIIGQLMNVYNFDDSFYYFNDGNILKDIDYEDVKNMNQEVKIHF